MTETSAFETLLGHGRAVPVVTFKHAAHAVPVGRALLAGGVRIIEITLRTPAGLDALRALAEACPELVLGAGTVLDRRQAEASIEAGATFLVSPGSTASLMAVADELPVPWLFGAATVSEVMGLRERGFLTQKFFPAEQSGGTATLKAIAAVLPDVRLCPTGGITPETASRYLDLPNVMAIGGSWFVPGDEPDSAEVTRLARQAASLFNR